MPKVKQFDEVAVLEKAQAVFSEKGYNGTSMDDLVKATGLSRSSIYDTFTDKHGLYLKALNHYRCEQNSNLEELLKKTDSPRKKITLTFDVLMKMILADKKRAGCLMVNAGMEMTCIDKEVADLASDSMEESEHRFYEWVKAGQAAGEITKRFSAKALSRHLYNSYLGLRTIGRTRPDPGAIKDIIRVTLAVLDQ